jgi:hypothetical protein
VGPSSWPVDGRHLPAVPATDVVAGTDATIDHDIDGELARAIAASGSGQPSREQLNRVMTLGARSARAAGVRAVTSGRWLAEISLAAAAHMPVRDLPTLRQHYAGLEGPALAGALIRSASRTSAGVGGLTGALAAASELTPATWAALPFELLVETLVIVAVEMKLVAELHEVAHQGLRGTLPQRGTAIATAWSEMRGFRATDLVSQPLSATAAGLVGSKSRSHLLLALRKRILVRAGRNVTTFAPMLAGAAVGAELNRRFTRKLGKKVASSLGIKPPR